VDQFKIFRPFSTRFVKSNAHINVIGGGGGGGASKGTGFDEKVSLFDKFETNRRPFCIYNEGHSGISGP
jgi:hypothetical protein